MSDIDIEEAAALRSKYTHFRVLVIGRANAGKTTLLKRVCNTSDEPCIFDEENNNLLEPTAGRGVHDIRRPFAFSSNPEFIFHDSPGFEAGGERELLDVQSFIQERAKSTEVKDQLHAIWFCLVTDGARPLLELEKRFFNEKRAGNVPVVAIFTKFDDLITQFYDMDKGEEENHEYATKLLEEKFRKPLRNYKFPPQADICFEAIHDDEGDHQEQVKELIDQTTGALDNPALKLLLVSVQQNNLELCIKYAITYSFLLHNGEGDMHKLVRECLIWFKHSYKTYDYGETEQDDTFQWDLYEEGGYYEEKRRRRIANSIIEITKGTLKKPSWTTLSAILILLTNTFWQCSMSKSTLFIDAFRTTFQLYIQSSMKHNINKAVLALGTHAHSTQDHQAFKSALLKVILDHCSDQFLNPQINTENQNIALVPSRYFSLLSKPFRQLK